VLAASLTLLSPLGAIVGLPALAALGVVALGRRRADGARRALRLAAPPAYRDRARVGLAAGVAVALTLAASQPALTHEARARVRRDVQALFVVDTSRSMAASTKPGSPNRLDRATAAAARLRGALPDVAAGVATLTDRVLPDLLPAPDILGFDGVTARAVAIESPPPKDSAVRATSFDALASIPGGGFFAPGTASKLVVVLTDGESSPVQTNEIVHAFAAAGGFHLVFIRFWGDGEAIYGADGRREAGYVPDPSGDALVRSLAAALGANAYGESDLAAARQRLVELAGHGPTAASVASSETHDPIAPYLAAVALAFLLAGFAVDLPVAGTRIRFRGR
jgi:hypothetical protein